MGTDDAEHILDETLNVTIQGHHGEELENGNDGGNISSPSEYASTVEEISPAEAIKMGKCIVFKDTLISPIKSFHGVFLNEENVSVPLE